MKLIRKGTNWKVALLTVWKNRKNIIRYYPKLVHMANHAANYSEDERYEYTVNLMDILMKTCGVNVEVFGLENIPENDGMLICSNHQEKFDPLIIWNCFPRKTGVVVNDAACHRPFIREVCLQIRSLKLYQRNMHSMIETINQLTKELSEGQNYMIFPEGWYEEDPFVVSEFRGGCFKSAIRSKTTILPVALIDSYRLFKKDVNPPYNMQIHFLKPIPAEEYKGLRTVEIAELVRGRVQEAVLQFQKRPETEEK